MEYNTFIDEIVEKYGYKDNVRRAIEIAIPLMIKKYGESRIEDVLNVFRNVEICTFTEKTKEAYDEITERMLGDTNSHVVDATGANYGPEDHVPGSKKEYFCFEQDSARIYSAFRVKYNINLATEKNLHWFEFIYLFKIYYS